MKYKLKKFNKYYNLETVLQYIIYFFFYVTQDIVLLRPV